MALRAPASSIFGSLLCLALLGGCAGRYAARREFSKEFRCDYQQTSVNEVDSHYLVSGCKQSATYICWPAPTTNEKGEGEIGETCRRSDVDVSEAPKETSGPVAPPGRTTKDCEVTLQNDGDKTMVLLELTLDENTLLRVAAARSKEADAVQLTLFRREPDAKADSCAMDFMAKEQLVARPLASHARQEDVLTQQAQVSRKSFADLSGTEQLAVRVCKKTWPITPAQTVKLREFDARLGSATK